MGARRKRTQRQRDAKRKRRKDRPKDDPLIGYVGTNGTTVVCKGNACIVAGSEEQMARFVQDSPASASLRIEPASFSTILRVYLMGEAYCFDELAYSRFLPLGRAMGLPLPDPDFSHCDPSQVKLMTIFRKDLRPGW